MILSQEKAIEITLNQLFKDAKNDYYKIAKGLVKSAFRPMQPSDFKEAYLSISKEQGADLQELILKNNSKNIIEFGTSFGISTLFLAQGVLATGGKIITTELIESKALKAIDNFKNAGVQNLIEVRIGDALETLKNHAKSIDFLFLDGWKDLYLPLFEMLAPNFHINTIIYVDNANMLDAKTFLQTISKNKKYQLQPKFGGKVVLITIIK